ncbi:MAG: hypothetical protein NC394_06405 [Bacteroides sp.]|nr:hypothetical protein [Bacteroides sp.]
MGTVLKAKDFVNKVKNIAQNYNTVYCWGSFGFPVTQANITRLAKQYSTIYTASMQNKLKGLIGKNYFGFDCVGLIKGVLWGFTGDNSKSNGGTSYCSNGVNDIDCNAMFELCSDKSSDFSNIIAGEFLWMQGHIGVYIGDGLAVESTANWNNKVQITAVGNIGNKSGYNSRKWTKHGKSPFIDYNEVCNVSPVTTNSITNCKNIYLSEGVAALRSLASTSGTLKGRCNKKDYYVACQIVSPVGNKQTWFKHANNGFYSALNDVDGTKLFSLYGKFIEGKTNAPVKTRATAGLDGTEVGKLTKGATVYMTGKTTNENKLTWCQVVYGGKLCWCDKQWISG